MGDENPHMSSASPRWYWEEIGQGPEAKETPEQSCPWE